MSLDNIGINPLPLKATTQSSCHKQNTPTPSLHPGFFLLVCLMGPRRSTVISFQLLLQKSDSQIQFRANFLLRFDLSFSDGKTPSSPWRPSNSALAAWFGWEEAEMLGEDVGKPWKSIQFQDIPWISIHADQHIYVC